MTLKHLNPLWARSSLAHKGLNGSCGSRLQLVDWQQLTGPTSFIFIISGTCFIYLKGNFTAPFSFVISKVVLVFFESLVAGPENQSKTSSYTSFDHTTKILELRKPNECCVSSFEGDGQMCRSTCSGVPLYSSNRDTWGALGQLVQHWITHLSCDTDILGFIPTQHYY